MFKKLFGLSNTLICYIQHDCICIISWFCALHIAVFLDEDTQDSCSPKSQESKLPLQLAIVGRPNVGKSTLLNTLLQEERVLVGPEAGLTRDSIRAQFQYDDRTVYMVESVSCALLHLLFQL